MDLAMLAGLFSSLMMTGIVWFVQIIHYPLMSLVGHAEFQRYEQQHTRLAGMLIAPIMLVELVTTILVFSNAINAASIALIALLAIIWLSTFFIQVPLHRKLSVSYNNAHHAQLVRTNWVRTIAWTIKSSIMLFMTVDF